MPVSVTMSSTPSAQASAVDAREGSCGQHGDLAALRRVFDRIVQQIGEHLHQPFLIAGDERQIGVDLCDEADAVSCPQAA